MVQTLRNDSQETIYRHIFSADGGRNRRGYGVSYWRYGYRLYVCTIVSGGPITQGRLIPRRQLVDARLFVSASNGCQYASQIAMGLDHVQFAGFDLQTQSVLALDRNTNPYRYVQCPHGNL